MRILILFASLSVASAMHWRLTMRNLSAAMIRMNSIGAPGGTRAKSASAVLAQRAPTPQSVRFAQMWGNAQVNLRRTDLDLGLHNPFTTTAALGKAYEINLGFIDEESKNSHEDPMTILAQWMLKNRESRISKVLDKQMELESLMAEHNVSVFNLVAQHRQLIGMKLFTGIKNLDPEKLEKKVIDFVKVYESDIEILVEEDDFGQVEELLLAKIIKLEEIACGSTEYRRKELESMMVGFNFEGGKYSNMNKDKLLEFLQSWNKPYNNVQEFVKLCVTKGVVGHMFKNAQGQELFIKRHGGYYLELQELTEFVERLPWKESKET